MSKFLEALGLVLALETPLRLYTIKGEIDHQPRLDA